MPWCWDEKVLVNERWQWGNGDLVKKDLCTHVFLILATSGMAPPKKGSFVFVNEFF